MPDPVLSSASLYAVAAWNVDRAAFLLREDAREKNNERCSVLQRDAGRLLRNADHCRRTAWMMEHKRRK